MSIKNRADDPRQAELRARAAINRYNQSGKQRSDLAAPEVVGLFALMYRGTVKNGVVVIDGGASLNEGTRVRITEERPKPAGPRAGSRQALLRAAGKWSGPPGELRRLLAELREMKQTEVAAEQARLIRPARGKRNGRR